ncbi:hypothetical protein CS022_21255 [Veronia nyctiphanis]|uniref:Superinfection immunity protein n=1 Tax=Veronia nyctiphanis TaxID=1278244 RepID=A0A4Q0YL12_9GAMM|nr:superinfection immunity protein [Veronia nyctiphanis]RXJ71356.1 hypothetical protein CS022_21255 [Veronia nyctiphanis]
MEFLTETYQSFMSALDGLDPVFMTVVIVLTIVVWFVPTIIAIFCNRKHLGKIFIANVPAGLSWIAWSALIIWAATGKMKSKKTKDEAASA